MTVWPKRCAAQASSLGSPSWPIIPQGLPRFFTPAQPQRHVSFCFQTGHYPMLLPAAQHSVNPHAHLVCSPLATLLLPSPFTLPAAATSKDATPACEPMQPTPAPVMSFSTPTSLCESAQLWHASCVASLQAYEDTLSQTLASRNSHTALGHHPAPYFCMYPTVRNYFNIAHLFWHAADRLRTSFPSPLHAPDATNSNRPPSPCRPEAHVNQFPSLACCTPMPTL